MRFCYADPPYPGQSKKHYEGHADYAGEVDHGELIDRLLADYDGWALSTHVPALFYVQKLLERRGYLPMDETSFKPGTYRIGCWLKSFASWKRNVYPAYAWEPVIFMGGRSRYGEIQTPRDFIVCPITLEQGTSGAKPEQVCHWIFDCLGLIEGDEFADLFPGSGAVGRALRTYFDMPRLSFPAEAENVELDGFAA